MQTLHSEISINAPREKVWDIMLGDETYRKWTEPFSSGSYYKGSWEQGSKILFVGPGESGESGMVSRIKENRHPEFISIEHVGIVMNGIEDTTSDEAKKWTPAFENYTFTEEGGGTKLSVDLDVAEENMKMFAGMWPKALQVLKELCEK